MNNNKPKPDPPQAGLFVAREPPHFSVTVTERGAPNPTLIAEAIDSLLQKLPLKPAA